MNWVPLVLEIVKSGLNIWEHKEKRKYVDKINKIEKELYEQEAKPFEERDQALIDNLHFDLVLVSRAFAQDAGSHVANKS